MPYSVARPTRPVGYPWPTARNFQPSPRRYSSPQMIAVSSPVSGLTSNSGDRLGRPRPPRRTAAIRRSRTARKVAPSDEAAISTRSTDAVERGQIGLDGVGEALGDPLLGQPAHQARGVARLVVEDEVLVRAHPAVGGRAAAPRRPRPGRRRRATSAARPVRPGPPAGRSIPSASRASCRSSCLPAAPADNAGPGRVRPATSPAVRTGRGLTMQTSYLDFTHLGNS